MAASSSSSSSRSYASSFGLFPYTQNLTGPVDSNWTPSSEVSACTEELSTPQGQLRPLDLGPPGFQAIIVLFEGTPDERTVYLGPWEVIGSEQRRVVWQCSYQLERFEHFLPSPTPANAFPHTLHARHRQFSDPCLLEQFVTFRERHRVRYTNEDGLVIFDQPIEVKYEFTSVETSIAFQGDLRRKELVDCFDVDVIWTDVQGRTDSFGNVRGIGTVQRLKLWRDWHDTSHSLAIFANRAERRYREWQVDYFDKDIRHCDERRRTLRLTVRGRRTSAPDTRRIHLSAFRPRQRSVGGRSDQATSSASSPSSRVPLDIRYIGIQFTRTEDYQRFLDTWVSVHSSDSEFHGISYPQDAFELPSPQILPGSSYELADADSHYTHAGLQTVPEPAESTPGDSTP